MKKKIIPMLIATAALSLAACGNQTKGNGEGNDSLATDSIVEATPGADLHTEEAIKAQITA